MLIQTYYKKKNITWNKGFSRVKGRPNIWVNFKKNAGFGRFKKFFSKKKYRDPKVSMFSSDEKRHKALDYAYDGYNRLRRLGIRSTEPRHFFLFKAWGRTRPEADNKSFRILNNNISYFDKGIKFKANRSKKQYKQIFSLLGENKPFWAVSWWKANSKVIAHSQWDGYLSRNKVVKYLHFYKNLNDASARLKRFDLKRLSYRAVQFFIKNSFKIIFTRLFSFKGVVGLLSNINKFYLLFKKMKLIFSSYHKFVSLLINSNHGLSRHGAVFLSNVAFSKVYYGHKSSENALNPNISKPVWSPFRGALAETYLVNRPNSSACSSYFRINSFTLLKFFVMFLKSIFKDKKNVYISPLVKLMNARTEKKLIVGKKEIVVKKTGVNSTITKKNFYRKVYFTLLMQIKNHFSKNLSEIELLNYNKLVLNPNKPRIIKKIPGARGFFFYLRKRQPKYFKSNKKLRLFKKFVRKYKYSVRASYNIKNIMGAAAFYFQVVGIKKEFKQKIFYRAVFKHLYALKDDKKMYNRWKIVKRSRSKWIGFYKQFEGHLWRAVRWMGFSNKIKLSRFLVDNGLIFINGKVVTDSKAVVDANDIVYLRKDIHALMEEKIWNRLTKKAISSVPYYNSLLKEKLINKAARAAKGLLRKSSYFSRMHEKRIRRFKSILASANHDLLKKNYNKSFTNLDLKRIQWARHLKKISSIKLILAKKMLLGRAGLHSALAEHNGYSKNATFYFKKNNTVMLHAKPRSITDFFNTINMKYKKAYNPRAIKDFIERNYKH